MFLTPESRIEDLDKLLTKHGLMMTAVATGNLWTISLDSRQDLGHYVGSGNSLYEALKRALDKCEKKAGDSFAPETKFNGERQVRPGKK